MKRFAALVYGLVCYAIFFVNFLYLVGFLGNLVVPKSIDSGEPGPLLPALLINTSLLLLFGLQHTIMARPGFKDVWTRVIPRPVERATYVLLTSLILMLIYWQWRPITTSLWQIEGAVRPVIQGIYLLGVALVLYATFLIDHFDLFGVRQVVLYFQGKEYSHKRFVTPSLYKFIRHPLYVGWLMTFWVTPDMTAGHLLFAAVWTIYILVAIPFEERDLAHFLGEDYKRYRERTPMFIPRGGGKQ